MEKKLMSEEVEVKNQMICLIGYCPKERFMELRSSFNIKNKNFEKRRSDDKDLKKALDDVIIMLKGENKKLKVMMRYISKTRENLKFLVLFTDRENKLKYSHASPEDMEDSLVCRLGYKKNILNLLLYRRQKVLELEKEMVNEIKYLDRLSKSGGYDSKLVEEISKLQADIEDIDEKYRVNSYIKRHYKPIIDLLNKEINIFPIRIKNAETALKLNKQELDDIRSIHSESKEAKQLAVLQMLRLQEDVERDRKKRGEVVLAVRKNMAQRYEALEKLKKRKTSTEDQCSEGSSDYIQQINKSKAMIPVLKEMRLAHYKINDLFGTIKSTLLETRIMNACQTMLNNDEMNENQALRKIQVDNKFKNMQSRIKQDNIIKVKTVQTISNKREECRIASKELEDKIKMLEKEIEDKKKNLTINGNLLMCVKKGIHAIGTKLSWLGTGGMSEGDSIEMHIANFNETLSKFMIMYQRETLNIDSTQTRQDNCITRLVTKNIEIQFSEEDTNKNGSLGAFDEVMEINDNTPMVRNYMKTASKRLVAKQKRLLGRR